MNPSDQAAIKNELRSRMRSLRQTLPDSQRRSLDRRIRRHLLAKARTFEPGTIAGFLAFDGEPDLAASLLELRSAGWSVALPVLTAGNGPGICLQRWEADCTLAENRYGIPEPVHGEPVPLDQIDLLLMPLVAWDDSGARLGMGAGFYDRLLANRRDKETPCRVGVGYEIQRVQMLPRDEWDVPLHAILNPQGWFPFPP